MAYIFKFILQIHREDTDQSTTCIYKITISYVKSKLIAIGLQNKKKTLILETQNSVTEIAEIDEFVFTPIKGHTFQRLFIIHVNNIFHGPAYRMLPFIKIEPLLFHHCQNCDSYVYHQHAESGVSKCKY